MQFRQKCSMTEGPRTFRRQFARKSKPSDFDGVFSCSLPVETVDILLKLSTAKAPWNLNRLKSDIAWSCTHPSLRPEPSFKQVAAAAGQ